VVSDIRSEDFGIDRVPPTVSALDDDIEIVRVDVHVMLFTVPANDVPKLLFQLSGYGVFACVHMGNFSFLETPSEFGPNTRRHFVCFAYV